MNQNRTGESHENETEYMRIKLNRTKSNKKKNRIK